jgi:hypothetical protein
MFTSIANVLRRHSIIHNCAATICTNSESTSVITVNNILSHPPVSGSVEIPELIASEKHPTT